MHRYLLNVLDRLDAFLADEVSPEQLIAVFCTRDDDSRCGKVEVAAEIANRALCQDDGEDGEPSSTSQQSTPSSSAAYQIVKVNFAECQSTADKYNIRSMPAFLMFYGGRLAWAGTLGGSPVKAAPPPGAMPWNRILLVEPCAKV